MKVLITGSGGPAGTNIINFFPTEVAEIIACDSDPKAKKRLSVIGKKDIKFYKVPLARDKSFQAELTEIIEDENIDFIIPTVDEELVVLSESNAAYMDKVVISPKKTIKTCLDKKNLYDFFDGKTFCPKFITAYKRKQLEEMFEDRPIFMKPRIGRGSRGTKYFDNVDAVTDDKINTDNVFCEFLPGQEYTADVMCDMKGKPLVIIPRKRLDIDQGISVLGETEKREDIIENIKDICEELVFRGAVNIQFKLNEKGKAMLVEINPRFSGGLPITVASGVNMIEILVDILQKNKIDKKRLLWAEIKAKNKIAQKIGREYKQP